MTMEHISTDTIETAENERVSALSQVNEEVVELPAMRQSNVIIINRIVSQIGRELVHIVNELQRYWVDRSTYQYILRYIVTYTVNNHHRYVGNPEVKTLNLMHALRGRSPWIFHILRAHGMSQRRVSQLIRTIVAFTLANLVDTPDTLSARADAIIVQMQLHTEVFPTLQRYNVMPQMAGALVKPVVLYTLSNAQAFPHLTTELRSIELAKRLEATNPNIPNTFLGLGIPLNIVRELMVSIIAFTLRSGF